MILVTVAGGLALLVRLLSLWRLSEVHYDEAVNGLMARHILQGQFPIFYWGQDYAGTAAAFLISVAFALFDSSVTTLRLVPLGLSLLLLPLTYRLARAVYDVKTARLALLFAALPPLLLVDTGASAKDPYPELPVFGLLLLLLAIRLDREDRVDRARAFVVGLVGGIAWWTQLLVVAYLLAVGTFLLLRRHPTRLFREGGAAVVGFGLGSLPFWLYAVGQPATMGLLRTAQPAQTWQELLALLRDDLPFVLGASAPRLSSAADQPVSWLLALLYVPAGTLILYEALRLCWAPRSAPSRVLLSVTAMAVILQDAASGYRSAGGIKYLFPLYAVLPALLAHYAIRARRALGLAPGIAVAALILALHAHGSALAVADSRRADYLEDGVRPPMRRLIAFLQDHQLSRVYAHFRVSLKLTFDSREAIVASDWHGFRSRSYLEAVERAPAVALVAHRTLKLPDPATLEENLRALGGTFSKQDVDHFVIFYDFRPLPAGRSISPIEWIGRGVPRAESSPRAYDRDGLTWWGSGEPQRPGLAYELDLGRSHRLTGLSLHPGLVAEGAPRGYRIETSVDGRRWSEVVRVSEVLPGLHWEGAQPRFDRSGRVQAAFPPVEARYLRLTQTGYASHFWWSIGETFLYAEGAPADSRSPGWGALVDGERLERAARWEFIGASPVARAAWRVRPDVDWDGIFGAYTRAIRADPELEAAHHRVAVVLARLEVPPPGVPQRPLVLERLGAWRMAAAAYEKAGGAAPALERSAAWDARVRVARMAGETARAQELEQALTAEFTPPVPTRVTFGRRLRLLGLRLPPRVAPGQPLHLQAYWEALRPLGGKYEVSFVFKGASPQFGTGWRPVAGGLPPDTWHPGERVREDITVEIPPGTSPARYELHLKVHEAPAGRALRVWRFGLPTPRHEATVAVLDVAPGQ